MDEPLALLDLRSEADGAIEVGTFVAGDVQALATVRAAVELRAVAFGCRPQLNSKPLATRTPTMNGHRTVLVLGAGASFASKYALPTMARFWSASSSAIPEPLETFLAWFDQRNVGGRNLEDVLGYLDFACHRSPAWGIPLLPKELDAQPLYSLVLDEVRNRLTTPLDAPCGLHEKLFHLLEPTDTVVTLNYDLVADVALRAVEQVDGKLPQDSRLGKVASIVGTPNFFGGVPLSLLPREETTGFYLKLHGSLDWLRCMTSGCPNAERLFAVNLENLGKGQEAGRPCRLCGTPVQVFLVPPVVSKRTEDKGRLAFLWNLALRELQAAEHVMLIGLSFAPSDFELRWLLRAARSIRDLAKVSVANPDSEACASAKTLLGSSTTVLHEYHGLAELLDRVGTAHA